MGRQAQEGEVFGTGKMEPTSLDPSVQAAAKAIRQTESGGNFTVRGKSGEFGAYQFTPDTWNAIAPKYGVAASLEQASPEDQNKVAYMSIKEMKDSGFNMGQVASTWNAGVGEKDAYAGKFSDGSPSTGTNKYGVKFDVPAYAKSVATAYHTLKGGGQVGMDPNNPSSVGHDFVNPNATQTGVGNFVSPPALSDVPVAPSEPAALPGPPKGFFERGADEVPEGGQYLGEKVLKKVGNFALPIIGDLINDVKGKSDKSALRQLGDLGLSALWFLPFGAIAEGAGVGLRAAGLGAEAARTAGIIGTGVATGYAGDVSSHLAEGQSGTEALKPGLGTVVGGGLAGASIGAAGVYNKFRGQQQTVDSVIGAYEDALGATKTGVRASSKVVARGAESPAEFLAYAGLAPETAEVNGRRIFTTGPESNTYKAIQERANKLTELRDAAIDQGGLAQDLGGGTTLHPEPPRISVGQLKDEATKRANELFLGTERAQAIQHINQEMDAFMGQLGEEVDLKGVNTMKKYFQGNTNYDATRPSTITDVNRMIGGVLQKTVEQEAESAGIKGIRELNKIIQQHLDFLDTNGKKGILSKLNGQVIKGGRIGMHVKEAIGGAIGLSASHALGGGLVGDIAGGIVGAKAGNLVARWLQRLAVGGSMTAATLGRIAEKEPEVVMQFLEYLSRQGDRVAPRIQPVQQTSAGLMQKLLNKSVGDRIIR